MHYKKYILVLDAIQKLAFLETKSEIEHFPLPRLGLLFRGEVFLRREAGVFEVLASFTEIFTVLGLVGGFEGGIGDVPL